MSPTKVGSKRSTVICNISDHFPNLTSIRRCALLVGPLHNFSTPLHKSNIHLKENSLTEFPLGPLMQDGGKAANWPWCVFTKYNTMDESHFLGYITFSYILTPLLNW